MSNKRVSQLVELTAGEVSSNDLLLIVDSSARESKKLQAGQLLSYIVASGSFNATTATTAATASYIDPNNVGLIPSASHGITSRTASFALTTPLATTASFAVTASFVIGAATPGLATSASFLVFTPGTSNGTASFAMTASTARNAFSSSFLIYTGTGNGTASYAIQAANAVNSVTASYFNPAVGSASFATASWAYEALHALDSDTSDVATLALSADFLNYDGITPNGTASLAISSSYALSSSFALFARSASFSQINVTSSYTVFAVVADFATSASWASRSFAATSASWASASFSSSYAVSASKLTSDSNAFLQNGNSFGAIATIGTDDSNAFTIKTNQNRWATINSTGRIGLGVISPDSFHQITMKNSQSLLPRTLFIETDTSTAGTTGSYTDAKAMTIGTVVGVGNTVEITNDITTINAYNTLTGLKTYPTASGITYTPTFASSCSVTASVSFYSNFDTLFPGSSVATVLNAYGFRSLLRNRGGGVIVSGSSFYSDPITANSASYGLYLNRNSASIAANQFGIYQLGADNINYFEGIVSASLYGTASQAVTSSMLRLIQSSSTGPTLQTTASGWMQVNVGGTIAYIPLYI